MASIISPTTRSGAYSRSEAIVRKSDIANLPVFLAGGGRGPILNNEADGYS